VNPVSALFAGPAPLVTALLVVLLGASLRGAVVAGRRSEVGRRLPSGAPGGGAVSGHLGRLAGAAPRRLGPALADAGLDVDPARAWSIWWGAAVVLVPLSLLVAGPGVAGVAAAGVVAVPLVVLRSRRGRGDARLEAALPGALEAVARTLRSGASVRQAVDEAARTTPGPLGAELDRVATAAARGVPLVRALEELAERRPLPGVRLAVAALCLGIETGGAQARAVDGVATTLRERLGVAAEVRALAAQARMSAVVIGLAPLGFGAFAAATDPRTAQFALHTAPGLALLCAGVALDAVGWLWMNRLCRVAA
jgi:tight adherence protein B